MKQKENGCNIFENFNSEDFKNIRKKMTKMVISTDMSLHFEHIHKLKEFNSEKHKVLKEEDKTFLM